MTVFRPRGRRYYHYDFQWEGQRHSGSTKQTRVDDARIYENKLKERLRLRSGGLPSRRRAPTFSDWAEVYYAHVEPQLERPERVEELLRVVLRFWGRPPAGERATPDRPYHNLTLADPIVAPSWIDRFEEWMRRRNVRPQTRNHYRGIMSRMYRVAMLPRFRSDVGVSVNPFLGIPREQVTGRQVVASPKQIREWIAAAPLHARIALAIASLAPKLRLQNILSLRWDEHLDEKWTRITVVRHKTARRTGRPLVVPVSPELRFVLKVAQATGNGSPWVITYRGEPVESIRHAVQSAAKAAGLDYGRDVGGVTFHTIRHSIATELVRLGVQAERRQAVMGHRDPKTTDYYTHLVAADELPAHRALGTRLQVRSAFPMYGKMYGTRSDPLEIKPNRKGPVRPR